MQNVVAGVYLSETQNSIHPHSPHYTQCTCIQNTFLHMAGGGGELNQRDGGEGQQFTKLGRKYQHD
jgi:hypothetical protein